MSDLNKTAKKHLFKSLNCCETQVSSLKHLTGLDNENLINATTGLAGGLYNYGSTCGVVFGSSINIAVLFENEEQIFELAREYIDWFVNRFDSTLCRERTGLNFKKFTGKMGLLIPSKAKGCIKQTVNSISYFQDIEVLSLPLF